jgi:hypothetical protein
MSDYVAKPEFKSNSAIPAAKAHAIVSTDREHGFHRDQRKKAGHPAGVFQAPSKRRRKGKSLISPEAPASPFFA